MAVVLPELAALRGVEQNPYHHLDAYEHTIEVLEWLLAIERDLGAYAGDHAGAVDAILGEELAGGLDRRAALRLGALFHDLGKPETRTVNDDGRVLFLGHDRAGARIVAGICERLRSSRRLRGYLEGICTEHLRLGFLVHERPLSRRAVFEYLDATDPDSLDVTLLTVADRLATQGAKTRREAIDAHLELAREMIGEALAWREAGPPRPPIRGDELAAAARDRARPRARAAAARARGGGLRGRGDDARGRGRVRPRTALGLESRANERGSHPADAQRRRLRRSAPAQAATRASPPEAATASLPLADTSSRPAAAA